MTAMVNPGFPAQPSFPRWIPVSGAAAITGLIALADADGPVLCVFRVCTGAACPGCGLTRASAALVRGDVGLAWKFHPFVFLLALQAVVLGVIAATPSGRRGVAKRGRTLLAANLVGLLLLWIARWRLGLLDFVLAS